MTNQWMFVAKLTHVDDLCHTILSIGKSKQQFYNQALKCRQLLCLCTEVIVSPCLDDIGVIDAVMPVSCYKTKLMEMCKKLNLKPLQASMARSCVIERCVSYSLKFKVVSHWVQAGQFLINNPKFLSYHGKMPAVKLDLKVSDAEISIHLNPCLVRLPPPNLDSFGVCSEALQKFQDETNYEITEYFINLSWCYILPSMKRGQLVKISRNLDSGGSETVFKNYEAICRYWRNQYGYVLDSSECDSVYCSLYLKPLGQHLFTYPFVCVRSSKIQQFARCNDQDIVKEFMTNVKEKCNQICGMPLRFSSQSHCSVTHPASVIQLKQQKSRFSFDACENKSTNSIEDNTQVVPNNAVNLKPSNQIGKDVQCVPTDDVIPPTQDVDAHKTAVGSDTKKLAPLTVDHKLLSKFPLSSSGKFIPVFSHNRKACLDKPKEKANDKEGPAKKVKFNQFHVDPAKSGNCIVKSENAKKIDDMFHSANSCQQKSRKRSAPAGKIATVAKQTKSSGRGKGNARAFDSLFSTARHDQNNI